MPKQNRLFPDTELPFQDTKSPFSATSMDIMTPTAYNVENIRVSGQRTAEDVLARWSQRLVSTSA